METPHTIQTSIFFAICRLNATDLTIRVGSKHHNNNGTVHQVTGGFYHGNYEDYTIDYDVAVLRVCPDFDIPLDI